MGSMTEPKPDSQALVITGPSEVRLLEHAPTAVLEAAAEAARALRDVISQKSKPVMMNGEQYLEFEDWQLLGRFYGVTAKEDGDPEYVDLGGVQGFRASAFAIDRDGRELSRATAFCLNDEEKWGERTKYAYVYILADGSTSVEDPGPGQIVWVPNPNKPGKSMPKKERQPIGLEKVPLFQLASMAQTRANAKVLRNVLSWVAVQAGYRPTPAEEIEDLPTAQRVSAPQAGPPQAPPPEREPGEDNDGFPDEGEAAYDRHDVEPARPSAPPQQQTRGRRSDKPPCPQCGNAKEVIWSKKTPGALYCFTDKYEWRPSA